MRHPARIGDDLEQSFARQDKVRLQPLNVTIRERRCADYRAEIGRRGAKIERTYTRAYFRRVDVPKRRDCVAAIRKFEAEAFSRDHAMDDPALRALSSSGRQRLPLSEIPETLHRDHALSSKTLHKPHGPVLTKRLCSLLSVETARQAQDAVQMVATVTSLQIESHLRAP